MGSKVEAIATNVHVAWRASNHQQLGFEVRQHGRRHVDRHSHRVYTGNILL